MAQNLDQPKSSRRRQTESKLRSATKSSLHCLHCSDTAAYTFPESCLSVIFLISSSSCAPLVTHTQLSSLATLPPTSHHISFYRTNPTNHGQEEQKFQGQAIPGHSAQGSSPAQEASWSKQQQFCSLGRHQSVRECPRLVGQGIEISRPQPSHARLQPKCRSVHLARTEHGPPQTKSPNSSRE